MMKNGMPVSGFRFRLSARNPRDVELSHWLAANREDPSGVNASEVCKALLYAWLQQDHDNGGRALPAPRIAGLPGRMQEQEEEREDPNDPLVRNLLGLNVEEI